MYVYIFRGGEDSFRSKYKCFNNVIVKWWQFANIKFPSSQSHGEIYVWFEEFKIIQIKDMDHSDNMSMVIGGSDR